MDLSSLIGLAAGALVLLLAMASGGSLLDFIDLPSLAVTMGGTIAATLVTFPLRRVLGAFKVLRKAFTDREPDPGALTGLLIQYAVDARREGVLVLEEEADNAPDPFMRKGLGLVVDGTAPDAIREILELDLANMEERHKRGAALFETMAQYAPAFGMAGTVIGLVQMLQSVADPGALGADLASALLTTLYGILLANFVLLPIAGKLKARSAEESRRKELLIEGFVAIQEGEGPSVVAERLGSFLSPAERARMNRSDSFADDEEE